MTQAWWCVTASRSWSWWRLACRRRTRSDDTCTLVPPDFQGIVQRRNAEGGHKSTLYIFILLYSACLASGPEGDFQKGRSSDSGRYPGVVGATAGQKCCGASVRGEAWCAQEGVLQPWMNQRWCRNSRPSPAPCSRGGYHARARGWCQSGPHHWVCAVTFRGLPQWTFPAQSRCPGPDGRLRTVEGATLPNLWLFTRTPDQ